MAEEGFSSRFLVNPRYYDGTRLNQSCGNILAFQGHIAVLINVG
jgi:hypothetical protein